MKCICILLLAGLAALGIRIGGLGIGRNSIDVQLRNLTVDGASGLGSLSSEQPGVARARDRPQPRVCDGWRRRRLRRLRRAHRELPV